MAIKTRLSILILLNLASNSQAFAITELQSRILDAAVEILEYSAASYAYGGHQIGTTDQCQACNDCLAERQVRPKLQLQDCPQCQLCSLDCSHFTHLVFRRSGIASRYLQTSLMIDLTAQELLRRFHFIDLGRRVHLAEPGDLLVYRGHVAMLESRDGERGDIIHATAGRDVRIPGQGVQRERHVALRTFRGPLLRILRHEKVHDSLVGNILRPVSPSP